MRNLAELPESLRSGLLEHCEAGYPLEVCGALLGIGDGERTPWQVRRIIAGKNQHGDQHAHYQIAPESLLLAERQAHQHGEQVLGYFHSHPDSPAHASQDDCERAWPGYLYIICSVVNARTVDLAAFTLTSGSLRPLRIVSSIPTRPSPEETRTWPSRS